MEVLADCTTATTPSSEEEDEDESEEVDEEDDDGGTTALLDRRPALGGIVLETDEGPKVLLRSASLFRRSGLLFTQRQECIPAGRACGPSPRSAWRGRGGG